METPKSQGSIQKIEDPSKLIEKLADIGYRYGGAIDLGCLHDDIKQQLPGVLAILKKEKIKLAECTTGVGRAANEKMRTDQRQRWRESNAKSGNIPIVIPGDSEFDPFLKATPLSGASYDEKSREIEQDTSKSVDRSTAPTTKVPVEKKSLRWSSANPPTAVSGKHEKSKTTGRPVLYGYPFSAVVRWLAAKGYGEKDIRKVLAHFKVTISDQTIKCQVNAGKKGKNHYGPLPKISDKDHKELKKTCSI